MPHPSGRARSVVTITRYIGQGALGSALARRRPHWRFSHENQLNAVGRDSLWLVLNDNTEVAE